MANKRFLEIVVATGRYVGEWVGPEGDFTPAVGHAFIEKDEDYPRPEAGSTWNGETFDAPEPPAPSRLIRKGEFMDRFPLATQLALEQISEQQTTAGRMIRVFTRRLEAEDPVNLDSSTLLERLQQLAPVLTAAEVEGWADEEAAEATIAAILA